jgi:hypothetical protein
MVAMEKPAPSDPPIAPGGQRDAALRLLPGRGNRRIQRQAGFSKRIERDLPLILLLLPGGQCTLTAGQGRRITETLSRLSHPFPSKPCLCGQPFERRETEALLGVAGETRQHRFERTGLFFAIVLSKGLFVGGAFAWSATARLIMPTLGAMRFPCRDPGRHGDPMDLRGLGNGLDGRTGGTQQQTMGAAPRSACGLLLQRFF